MQKFSLFPHQKEAVTFLRQARYAILGDGMGLGKTLSALSSIPEGEDRVIVLCPASLKQVWALELTSKFPDRKYLVLTPRNIPRILDRILILNFEQLKHCGHLFRQASVVIVDEAHYLKTPKSQRTKAFTNLVKKHPPEFLFLLTGTPIKNNVPEIYMLLFYCGLIPGERTNGKRVTDIYPNQGRFCEALCHLRIKRVAGMMLQEWYGIKDAPALRSLLEGKYIARKLENVVSLPPLRESIAEVAKISREMELRDAFLKYQNKRDVPSPIKVQVAIEKAQFTVGFAKDLLRKGHAPIVIFTDHREPARVMHEALSKHCPTGLITGDVQIEKRNILIEKFQRGELDVLVATIGSAGVGVTLTASNVLIFNDQPWIPGDQNQAMKRIHRIGQGHECFVYFVTAPGFDRKISETLNRKAQTIHEALGGMADA